MARVRNFNSYMLRELVADTSTIIPTKNGSLDSINFDNAGTTPPFNSVLAELKKYSPWYKYISDKSIKAALLSELYEEGRTTIKNFVGADQEKDTVIYTKNTTEAINILSNVMCTQNEADKPVVITTYMEHMSDYLPWKFRCDTALVDVLPDGRLSMQDMEEKLKQYEGRAKLVAVAGAANVTGYINPIHKIARLAHQYGAQILVDSAQLVQHRTMVMNTEDPAERLDYVAFSAHKTYAPFFTGALVGNKQVLDNGQPLCYGAGMTKFVSDREIIMKESPQRYEGGSNNILGVIALITAFQTMSRVGLNSIRNHESRLLWYANYQLKKNDNVILYGDTNYLEDRVPIVAFNVKGKNHEEVAEYLYNDYGIIVKNGYCGADLYVKKLIEGTPYDGIIRVSMALYNQQFEIDRFITALKQYS